MNVKQEVLRVLKNLLYIIALGAAVGFLYHWVRGIYCSCVADDIITAQDRVGSAYQFLYMIGAGLVFCASLFPSLAIKVPACPEKLMALYKKGWSKFASLFRKKEANAQ